MRALPILAMAAREANRFAEWKRRVAAELSSGPGCVRGPARGTLVALTLISALATPVVVNAMTPKVNAVVTAAAVAAPKQEAPACTRMIRVVYAGYGEGQGAPCSVLVR